MEIVYVYTIVILVLVITGGLLYDCKNWGIKYVKIKKCSNPHSWYAKHVGGFIMVTRYNKTHYMTIRGVAGKNNRGYILVADTKIKSCLGFSDSIFIKIVEKNHDEVNKKIINDSKES